MLVHIFPLLNGTKEERTECGARGIQARYRIAFIGSPITLLSAIKQFVRGAGSMEAEHLTYRIRELCARAIMAEGSEVEPIIKELQAALRVHARLMRARAAETFRQTSELHSAKAAD